MLLAVRLVLACSKLMQWHHRDVMRMPVNAIPARRIDRVADCRLHIIPQTAHHRSASPQRASPTVGYIATQLTSRHLVGELKGTLKYYINATFRQETFVLEAC